MILGHADDSCLASTHASRATFLSMIVGAHALVLLAVVSIGGAAVVVHQAPMLLTLLPEAPKAPPPIAVKTLPLPSLRKPDIVVPEPPRFDVIEMVQVVERPIPPAPPQPRIQPSATPTPEAPPVLEPPRFGMAYLNNPAPAYPVFAKRAREQGVVMLRVSVDATGNVERVEIDRTSGSQRLDEAALAAVRRWRFQPARLGDRPVAGIALVPIHFQLEG